MATNSALIAARYGEGELRLAIDRVEHGVAKTHLRCELQAFQR